METTIPAPAPDAAREAQEAQRDAEALWNLTSKHGTAWALSLLAGLVTNMGECFGPGTPEAPLSFENCDKLARALEALVPTAAQADAEIGAAP